MKSIPAVAIVSLILGGAVVAQHASPASAGTQPAQQAGTTKARSPFACRPSALTAGERTRHFDELGPKLRALRTRVLEISDGYEFEFPGDAATYRLLTEWAAGERACCPFFDIDLRSERDGGPVRLRVTGGEGVKQFIEADAAAWIKK